MFGLERGRLRAEPYSEEGDGLCSRVSRDGTRGNGVVWHPGGSAGTSQPLIQPPRLPDLETQQCPGPRLPVPLMHRAGATRCRWGQQPPGPGLWGQLPHARARSLVGQWDTARPGDAVSHPRGRGCGDKAPRRRGAAARGRGAAHGRGGRCGDPRRVVVVEGGASPHPQPGWGHFLGCEDPGAPQLDGCRVILGVVMRRCRARSCADLRVNQAEAEEARVAQAGFFKSGFAWFHPARVQVAWPHLPGATRGSVVWLRGCAAAPQCRMCWVTWSSSSSSWHSRSKK